LEILHRIHNHKDWEGKNEGHWICEMKNLVDGSSIGRRDRKTERGRRNSPDRRRWSNSGHALPGSLMEMPRSKVKNKQVQLRGELHRKSFVRMPRTASLDLESPSTGRQYGRNRMKIRVIKMF